jgi:hypothetical protein
VPPPPSASSRGSPLSSDGGEQGGMHGEHDGATAVGRERGEMRLGAALAARSRLRHCRGGSPQNM